ncbi:hypothetical protein D3C80_904100 [compost metagenome]
MAQFSGAYGLLGNAIGNQPDRRVVVVGQHHALFDAWMLAQGIFDFRQFDAVATNFHLAVAAPQEAGAAIGQVSAEVASAVAAVGLGAGEGVGHELFCGQCRVTPIA